MDDDYYQGPSLFQGSESYRHRCEYAESIARVARREVPLKPRPRNHDTSSGKWQYFRLVCSPNPARGGDSEWTAEEIAARASAELGCPVSLKAVGSTLTKLQNGDGVLLQYSDGGYGTPKLRLYTASLLGRELAAQLRLPRPDRPGPPTEHGVLPGELVLRVLATLPPTDRARAACVCRSWRALTATPALWADVRCDGLTHEQALAAVKRAGAALRSLHTGDDVDVLSTDDVVRLLESSTCPGLERLLFAHSYRPRLSEDNDFDVPSGSRILAACPSLRLLHCRLGVGGDDLEGNAAGLQQLCDFLRQPAVRVGALRLGVFDQVPESEVLATALGMRCAHRRPGWFSSPRASCGRGWSRPLLQRCRHCRSWTTFI